MCQLVLGAGALKTVGLKTITAKHLGNSFVYSLYKTLVSRPGISRLSGNGFGLVSQLIRTACLLRMSIVL